MNARDAPAVPVQLRHGSDPEKCWLIGPSAGSQEQMPSRRVISQSPPPSHSLAGEGASELSNIGGLPMGRGILLWLLGVPIPVIILIFFLFR